MSDQDSNVPAGFRVIPGYPRYAIDESGNVLSICKTGGRSNRPWTDAKRIKPVTNRDGYHFVYLRNDGNKWEITVHALVLMTFVGPRPDGMQCRHLDGNPSNNHVSNLVWGTSLENNRDRILHGTSGKGEKHSRAKLTAADVLEIRARAANGEKQWAITKDFPVTSKSISQIVLRETWKHI